MKITACVPTYNEEKRIRYCLQCLQWCDSVFVLDKSSTDRTVEIAREMGATVKVIPHEFGYDPHENDHLLSLDCDWVVFFTCSDLIDRSLALKVREIVSTTSADIITVPFKQYVLGIYDKASPWYTKQPRRLAARKSVIGIDGTSVHGALCFSSSNSCFVEGEGYMYHLTHETADGMMSRHIRYWRGEAEIFDSPSFKEPFRLIVKNILLTIKRGGFWRGWNIFALVCAYISYYLMSFVYIWEKKRSKAPEVYQNIRDEVCKQWE